MKSSGDRVTQIGPCNCHHNNHQSKASAALDKRFRYHLSNIVLYTARHRSMAPTRDSVWPCAEQSTTSHSETRAPPYNLYEMGLAAERGNVSGPSCVTSTDMTTRNDNACESERATAAGRSDEWRAAQSRRSIVLQDRAMHVVSTLERQGSRKLCARSLQCRTVRPWKRKNGKAYQISATRKPGSRLS